jgi:hypothetical protein
MQSKTAVIPKLLYVDVELELSPDTIALVCDADYWALRRQTSRQVRRDIRLVKGHAADTE